MPTRYFDDGLAIDSEGLLVLRNVYAEMVEARQLDPKSSTASELAESLVGLFKAGFRSPSELHHMLD